MEETAEHGTHSLDWHPLPPVSNPSTAAAISAASALPGTAERIEITINRSASLQQIKSP